MKKKPNTPRSRVKGALRRLWLYSRERDAAIKRDGYTCQNCHRKQSKAKGKEFKVEVHHRAGIDWDGVVDIIIDRVLKHPDELETLCKQCHEKIHEKEEALCQTQ